MDDVSCTGSESYLTNCSHTTNHNCVHYEDAGVRCSHSKDCTSSRKYRKGGGAGRAKAPPQLYSRRG